MNMSCSPKAFKDVHAYVFCVSTRHVMHRTRALRGKVNNNSNLVPRVLSLPPSMKYAGHVSMYTNQILNGGGSFT